jgi:hypothetical protein
MTMLLIATTRPEEMQPLGLGGQLVVDAASSIQAVLRRRLGPVHAALYAEPERDQSRGDVDWYADGEGSAQSLIDLPEPERSKVRAGLMGLMADIDKLAEGLSVSEEAGERRLGEMLRLSLRLPSERAVMVLQGRPVLVGWGHEPGNAGNRSLAVTGQIRALVNTAAMVILPAPTAPWRMPPASAAVAKKVSAGWPLLAAAILLLVPALALLDHDYRRLAAAGTCHVRVDDLAALDRWRQAELTGTKLDNRLAALMGQVEAAVRQCPVQPGRGG